MSFEGVMRNFPWVSRYVLVAYVPPALRQVRFRHEVNRDEKYGNGWDRSFSAAWS